MVQTAEDGYRDDGCIQILRKLRIRWNLLLNSLVRPSCIEIVDVGSEGPVQATFADNENMVEALSSASLGL